MKVRFPHSMLLDMAGGFMVFGLLGFLVFIPIVAIIIILAVRAVRKAKPKQTNQGQPDNAEEPCENRNDNR